MLLCLSLCIRVITLLAVNVPTNSLSTCMWIPCKCCRFSHCENGSFEVVFTDSRSSSRARERGNSLLCFTTACRNPDTLKSMSISSSWLNRPVGCPITGLSVLVWSASTFSSVSSSLSTRSTDSGTQLWLNGGPFRSLTVLEFVLSQPNKSSFPISWVSKQDGCSLTSLTVLDNCVFDFGWIRWVSLLLPATSESNSIIQLSLKEIVGGGRSDTHTFSCMISPDSITTTFVEKDDCVRSWLIELKNLSFEQVICRPNTPCFDVFSTFLLVPCKTWFGQVKLVQIFIILVHGIHSRKEYCLSFTAWILSSRYQSRICDGV